MDKVLPLPNNNVPNGIDNHRRHESTSSFLHRYKKWVVHTKLALLLIIVVLLVISTIALIFLVVLSVRQKDHVEDANFLNSDTSWRNKCERACMAEFDVPPLLVISMDGLHADYLERKEKTPAIRRIMSCGSRAEFMLPSYPSKTFPNHYSIVTGLYPESHGIVDNGFVDFQIEEKYFSKASKNPAWYYGEPIWNTVKKNDRKSAVFFWPGSEVKIQGHAPDYRMNYSNTMPFSTRIDQVIKWLELPATDRPSFIAMYFEQPDAAGHNAGPNSDAVDSALIYVDAMINYLAHRLDQKGYLGCINMVILSDHGMQKLKKSQFIAIEEFININDSNVEVFGGAIGNIHFPNKTGLNLASKMEKFARREGHKFRAYTKETMPKRYHYANNRRIGDIIIDAVGGTEIFKTYSELNASTMEGDHGFDNRLPSMRAIFGAYGPSVKENFTIPPFQNIELYNLFTDLMGLTNFAPNNGTRGLLNSILRKPKDYEETSLKELPDCIDMSEPSKILTKCGDGCQFEIPVDGDENIKCHKSGPVHVPERIENIDSLCVIRLCNATMIYNKDLDHPLLVESLLSTPIKNIDHRANCSVHLNIGMDLSGNETTTPTDCSSYQAKFNNGFNSTWITYFSDHEYLRFISQSQIQVTPGFFNGAWKELLQTIEKYQKHYKNLLLYSGPIYDTNFDGLADSPEMLMNMTQKKPTHFYIILIRCRGQWDESYGHCQNPEDTRTLAFVLPNISDDFNNLIPFEYLFRNTARIRDIEILTGLELFTNRDIYPPETALRLRTHVNQRLWQLEVDKEIL